MWLIILIVFNLFFTYELLCENAVWLEKVACPICANDLNSTHSSHSTNSTIVMCDCIFFSFLEIENKPPIYDCSNSNPQWQKIQSIFRWKNHINKSKIELGMKNVKNLNKKIKFQLDQFKIYSARKPIQKVFTSFPFSLALSLCCIHS